MRPSPDRRVIAVIGAECSGKSTLVADLARVLPAEAVPEVLRGFTDDHQRPPLAHEQPGIMAAQLAAEAATAARTEGWVVSDAGALMTAVYSVLYFSDDSLIIPAVEHHRTACALTLWCDIDLPWVPDLGHRDGPDMRLLGHRLIGRIVAEHRLPVVRIKGPAARRLAAAQSAIRAL